MFQAAIVEDEPNVLSYLRITLSAQFKNEGALVVFDSFDSGNKLMDMLYNHYHYDIIFLDIEMPEINGIDLCAQIRKIVPSMLVIFISNKDELVFQAFEVQPFRFIRKTHFDSQLNSLVSEILKYLDENTNTVIKIVEPLSKDIYSFDVRKIQYVEAQGKKCCIVSESGAITVVCRFMDIEQQLSEYPFVKTHRSYLVNCKYISYIGRTAIELTNKKEIPMSRAKEIFVKEYYLKYLANH